MVVTIHQPEHLPWLGFFDKVRQADVLVLLDSVQYRKNYFQNRNRILASQGAIWLTVPVLTKGRPQQAINEVRINNDGQPRWREKCWASLKQNYGKAAHWDAHAPFLEDLYRRQWESLSDLNEAIIVHMMGLLGIGAKVVRSSGLSVEGTRGELLLDICRSLGASEYLSGISGRDYLTPGTFEDADIPVRYQEFYHPIYKQLHEPFVPCLSAVDLVFNHGLQSRQILEGVGVETLDHVFE